MAAFTSKATGNWSADGQTTWNESGVPTDGDTVSIGAHTITVDVNTTVGTSPNDTTTKVLDLTNAASVLKVAAGATLTVKGNRGAVNGSTFTQEAGSTVTFDAAASGGTPTYTDVNAGFTKYIFNGSVGNLATIQAVSGRIFTLNANWSLFTGTYFVVRRAGNIVVNNISGNVTMSDGLFDASGQLNLTSTGTTLSFIFDRLTFQSGTHATNALAFTNTAVYASGTRRISGCIFDKDLVYSSNNFSLTGNYLGRNYEANSVARLTATTGNVFAGPQTHSSSAGARFNNSIADNYFISQGSPGNPHYAAVYAMDADVTASGNIFEQGDVDAVDFGDAIFPHVSGTRTVTVDNNIVLPISVAAEVNGSGTLITLVTAEAGRTVKVRHNTACVRNTGIGGNGMVAVSESQDGHAGEVSEIKSNIIWSTDASGTVVTRHQGTVNGVVTAAGADYNWRWNGAAGDNGLGYDDKAGNLDLWDGTAATGGDAAAAGVDAHGGNGDPDFVDATRNVRAWAVARGYGETTAEGLTALKIDLATRVPDLIAYVQAGFAPQNASLKDAGHDGVTIGAVEGDFPTDVWTPVHQRHVLEYALEDD